MRAPVTLKAVKEPCFGPYVRLESTDPAKLLDLLELLEKSIPFVPALGRLIDREDVVKSIASLKTV